MNTPEICEAAAAVIRRNGLHQHDHCGKYSEDFDPMSDAVDLLGAIGVAGGFAPEQWDELLEQRIAALAVAKELDIDVTFDGDPVDWDNPEDVERVAFKLGEWNDHYLRTAEEVIAVLESAAADLRAGVPA